MMEPGKHKLTEAIEGQGASSTGEAAGNQGPVQPAGQGPTPREVAEETRREQGSQQTGKHDQDRDDFLVHVGRGQQTHG